MTVETRPAPAVAALPAPARPDPHARALLVLACLLLAFGLWTIRSFLPALAWASILAIATWPLYRRVRRRFPPGGHDVLVPAAFTAAVALAVLVPLALAAVEFVRETVVVAHLAEEARRVGIPEPAWLSSLPAFGGSAAGWWQANLADPAGYRLLVERFEIGSFVGYGRTLGAQAVHRGVVFGFTLLALFFLYRDGERLADSLLVASRRALGAHGERVGRQMVASVHGTVDGLVLVGLGVGALMGIAYWVAGLPHPTLFGAATAIAATVPFGAPAVFVIAALVLLANGSPVAAAAIAALGFLLVFVADHFVRPALIGGATKLPFLWVLVGILGGVETWGLVGLFLGPAVMAALILLWRDWTDRTNGDPAR